MKFIWKFAAVIALAACGVVTWLSLSKPGIALADVARRVARAHTLQFEIRSTEPLPGTGRVDTLKVWCTDPALMRTEIPGGPVIISDLNAKTALLLDPATKTARKLSSFGGEEGKRDDMAAEFIAELRGMADKPSVPLGQKLIGGVKATGFRVADAAETRDIWADAKTGDPILIEIRSPGAAADDTTVITAFVLDAPLDPKLFSPVPPEGYRLADDIRAGKDSPGEADVVELLRLYAERTGGAFPPKLDDWGHFAVMLTKGKGGQDLDEKGKALLFHVGRASPFLSELKSAGGFGYRPDAAKAGDPKTIIFWYRPNAKEKVRYRAIFADLRVADVTADQVPSDPATR